MAPAQRQRTPVARRWCARPRHVRRLPGKGRHGAWHATHGGQMTRWLSRRRNRKSFELRPAARRRRRFATRPGRRRTVVRGAACTVMLLLHSVISDFEPQMATRSASELPGARGPRPLRYQISSEIWRIPLSSVSKWQQKLFMVGASGHFLQGSWTCSQNHV